MIDDEDPRLGKLRIGRSSLESRLELCRRIQSTDRLARQSQRDRVEGAEGDRKLGRRGAENREGIESRRAEPGQNLRLIGKQAELGGGSDDGRRGEAHL